MNTNTIKTMGKIVKTIDMVATVFATYTVITQLGEQCVNTVVKNNQRKRNEADAKLKDYVRETVRVNKLKTVEQYNRDRGIGLSETERLQQHNDALEARIKRLETEMFEIAMENATNKNEEE